MILIRIGISDFVFMKSMVCEWFSMKYSKFSNRNIMLVMGVGWCLMSLF